MATDNFYDIFLEISIVMWPKWKLIVVQFIICRNTGSDIFNVVMYFRRSKFLSFPILHRHWGIYFGHKDFSSLHIEHLELANASSQRGSPSFTGTDVDVSDSMLLIDQNDLKIPKQNGHTKKVFMCWSNWSFSSSISYYRSCLSYQIQLKIIYVQLCIWNIFTKPIK